MIWYWLGFCCYLFAIFQKPWWWPQCHMHFTCLFIVYLFPDSNIKPDSPGLRKLYLAKGCNGCLFSISFYTQERKWLKTNQNQSWISSHLNAILYVTLKSFQGWECAGIKLKTIPNYYPKIINESMTCVSDQNKGNQNWVGPSGGKYIKLTGSSLVLWISNKQKLKDWIDAFPSWLILRN